jgi:hypothetical protein
MKFPLKRSSNAFWFSSPQGLRGSPPLTGRYDFPAMTFPSMTFPSMTYFIAVSSTKRQLASASV